MRNRIRYKTKRKEMPALERHETKEEVWGVDESTATEEDGKRGTNFVG
jgi:hypothetical protein